MSFIQYFDNIKKNKVQFFNSTKFFNLLLHFSKNCTIKQFNKFLNKIKNIQNS